MKFRYIIHKPLIIRPFNKPERGKRNWKRVRYSAALPYDEESVCPGIHREISVDERRAGLKSKYLRSPDWGIHRDGAGSTDGKRNIKVYISLPGALFITPGAIRGFHIDNLSRYISKEITRDTSEWRVVGAIRIAYVAGGLISFPKVAQSHPRGVGVPSGIGI